MSSAGAAPTPRNSFSFSRLKAFFQCPLRYRYRYLEGRKEAFKSIEAYLGTVVHHVLEWAYRERDGGSPPTVEQALDLLAQRWETAWSPAVAIVRVDEPPELYMKRGREMIARFFSGVLARDRSTTVALETRLSHQLAEDVVFTGIADRVGRTEAGRLFVIDYKTSSREGDPSEFSEGLQAPLYAACVLERHGGESCLAGYHYLRHGTTRWMEVSRQGSEEVKARFLARARETQTADEYPANPGVLCAWCGFNRICPEAQVPAPLSGGQRNGEGDRS